jgi:hypothetical protein
MNLSLMRVSTLICLVGISMHAASFGDAPEIVLPTSDEWTEIYDPPTRIPAEVPAESKLRSELFDLLRAKANPSTQFSGSLKSFRNWAFFLGRTVDRSGNSLKNPPFGNDDAVGLWLRTQEGWIVVAHRFGHSDAFFIIWPEQYGVPRELLGMKKTLTDE